MVQVRAQFWMLLPFLCLERAFRKINKPQLVNSVNDKDCKVEVEFTIGKTSWKVVRGIKPAIFEIWKEMILF